MEDPTAPSRRGRNLHVNRFPEEGRQARALLGPRPSRRLSLDNFGEDRFHHVILTTFGLPHGPLLQPVSLTEIGRIAGLITNHASVSPTVEFTVTSAEHWDEMKSTANLRWNGDVVLEQGLVNRVFGTLRRYQPWGKDGTRPGTTSMDLKTPRLVARVERHLFYDWPHHDPAFSALTWRTCGRRDRSDRPCRIRWIPLGGRPNPARRRGRRRGESKRSPRTACAGRSLRAGTEFRAL